MEQNCKERAAKTLSHTHSSIECSMRFRLSFDDIEVARVYFTYFQRLHFFTTLVSPIESSRWIHIILFLYIHFKFPFFRSYSLCIYLVFLPILFSWRHEVQKRKVLEWIWNNKIMPKIDCFSKNFECDQKASSPKNLVLKRFSCEIHFWCRKVSLAYASPHFFVCVCFMFIVYEYMDVSAWVCICFVRIILYIILS